MLGKLLKYDLKYMLKNMSIFYILAILFSITTRILFSLKQTVIVSILGQISVGGMFALVANIIINTVIRTWVRFKDSIYGDEGYLTNTLPVTKTQIYESRFIQSFIFTIVGFVVVLGCLSIAYLNKDLLLSVKNIVNALADSLNINSYLALGGVSLVVFLELFNAIQCGFLGIIIGNRFNNHKVPFSFLFGLIAYVISQNMVVILVLVLGIFNRDILSIFTSTTVANNNIIIILAASSIFIYILIIFIMNIVCVKILKKGVNI